MFIRFKLVCFEQSITTFWKEERQGYNIYENEQKQFFRPGPPPYTLNGELRISPKGEHATPDIKLEVEIFPYFLPQYLTV